jgi:hypothetical protein
MAENFFDATDRRQMQQRIVQLPEHAVRQWGTMTAPQMLRHCRAQLDLILHPDPKPLVHNTALRFAPIRWLAIYLVPWPKGSPTAPQMDVNKKLKDVGGFDEEKQLLLQSLEDVSQMEAFYAVHPLFGRLGRNDWGRIIWKHLDHHLRQFDH